MEAQRKLIEEERKKQMDFLKEAKEATSTTTLTFSMDSLMHMLLGVFTLSSKADFNFNLFHGCGYIFMCLYVSEQKYVCVSATLLKLLK